MQIEEFNALEADAATQLVRACADVGWWVDGLVARRPFASAEALLADADLQARRWTAADLDTALAHHPRIGDRPTGSGERAEMSRREQAAVLADPASDTTERIAAGNRRYEQTFDRIFLVRAAGRSAEEILANLESRLDNDPETEAAVTLGELREIAVLRLEGMLT